MKQLNFLHMQNLFGESCSHGLYYLHLYRTFKNLGCFVPVQCATTAYPYPPKNDIAKAAYNNAYTRSFGRDFKDSLTLETVSPWAGQSPKAAPDSKSLLNVFRLYFASTKRAQNHKCQPAGCLFRL